jgi:cytochrome c biogenesis protein
MKSLLKTFSSVKLAIVLLIIITTASIIGTLIPQQRSPGEYVAPADQLKNLFDSLVKADFELILVAMNNMFQFNNLYQSIWFLTLLFLFALNILICTLTRLPQKFRKAFHPKLIKDKKNILVLKTKDSFRKNWGLDKTKEELEKELSSRHYRLKEKVEENKAFLSAKKRTLGLFGADVVHLGLLIILAGGIISGLGGFRKNLTFVEGDVHNIPDAEFKLRLDKFETEYYLDGNVRDWKSTLTVIENEKTILSKIIEVNHPLSHKGYVFYQTGYGWDWTNTSVEIWVKKREDPSFLRKIEISLGQRARLEGENIHISVIHFIPDFMITERNEVTSRSRQPNNPATFIEGWKREEKIFSGWIFSKYPNYARIHSEKETDLSFELKSFKAGQYSVIEAAKDPGANTIWVGCTFLMIGLALAFYWPSREIKIILEETQGKTGIIAGGIASKNREGFQTEFDKIMSSLRRSK